MTDFGIVTANMPVRMGSKAWIDYHKKNIRPVASIVCCQESPHRQDETKAAYGTKDWKWFGDMTPINEPFIIKTSVWDPLEIHSYKGAPAAHVGPAGAGPDTLHAKYIHWMVLKNKANGKKLHVYNNHAVPSIYIHIRDQLHEEHMRSLAHAIDGVAGPCLAVGDMNAEWSNANYAPLKKIGVILDNPKGPTHENRQIDLVLRRNGKGSRSNLRRVSGKVLPIGAPHDHHGVLVKYWF